MAWLRPKVGGHVSWERVLSRSGLASIYEFLAAEAPERQSEAVAAAIVAGDAADAIVRAATVDADPLSHDALQWFMELYGSEAGNLALKYLATGGMFVGGSIAAKIAEPLTQSRFVERFDDKGRLRSLLETIAIRVVTNDCAALQGAAYYASRRAHGERD